MEISFIIPGEPKGKGRPRFTKSGHTYTPKETTEYEKLVKICYKEKYQDFSFEQNKPLNMFLYIYFPVPKSASKKKQQQMIGGAIYPTKKPDIDNIIKIIADSLNKVAYHDDTQLVSIYAHKLYSDRPRVEVLIAEKGSDENADTQ